MLIGKQPVANEIRNLWLLANVAIMIALLVAPFAVALQLDGALGFLVGLGLTCGAAAIRTVYAKQTKK